MKYDKAQIFKKSKKAILVLDDYLGPNLDSLDVVEKLLQKKPLKNPDFYYRLIALENLSKMNKHI